MYTTVQQYVSQYRNINPSTKIKVAVQKNKLYRVRWTRVTRPWPEWSHNPFIHHFRAIFTNRTKASNMASLGPCSFCSKCGFCLENEFKFCPKCGVKVRTFPTGRCETTTTPFSLPNFHTFKSQKESERKTFFARKAHAGHKKRKVDDEMVTINVGVMKEKGVIKRGETLPLKVPSTENGRRHSPRCSKETYSVQQQVYSFTIWVHSAGLQGWQWS